MSRVNLIDSDVRRRAKISRELSERGFHVEIYESAEEFIGSAFSEGPLFVSDEGDAPLVDQIGKIRDVAATVLSVIVYAEKPVPERIVMGMYAGAADYLRWPFDPHLLHGALRRAARSDREKGLELRQLEARNKVRALSRREAEVLVLVVKGCSNKEIGRDLRISPRTVEIHRAHMMDKLDAQSAADAIRIGIYAGLDEEPTARVLRAVA